MYPIISPIRSCFSGLSRFVTLAILLAVSVWAVSQVTREGVNGGKDKQEIKHLISMYAKAADRADPTLASHIWCNSSDESLINPVGRWQGVQQIRDFYLREMGDTYSSRNLKMTDISVQVYSDTAWAEFNWGFSATRRNEGSSVSFRGIETQIYRKNHDRWCLVHVHYSTLQSKRRLEWNE